MWKEKGCQSRKSMTLEGFFAPENLFCTFSTPHRPSVSLPSLPEPPPQIDICGAAPRWRSPQLRRSKRGSLQISTQAGRRELSAGTTGWAGRLSHLAPGGCAGCERRRLASASAALGAPQGLARAPHAPSLALAL